ncbi:hypothetical protein RN02_30045 [Pseudomonas sp. PI1]|jgi:hypothetical protein|nr:hypothetical protein RN02_30045 [Pseudomonas sp. PI1]
MLAGFPGALHCRLRCRRSLGVSIGSGPGESLHGVLQPLTCRILGGLLLLLDLLYVLPHTMAAAAQSAALLFTFHNQLLRGGNLCISVDNPARVSEPLVQPIESPLKHRKLGCGLHASGLCHSLLDSGDNITEMVVCDWCIFFGLFQPRQLLAQFLHSGYYASSFCLTIFHLLFHVVYS